MPRKISTTTKSASENAETPKKTKKIKTTAEDTMESDDEVVDGVSVCESVEVVPTPTTVRPRRPNNSVINFNYDDYRTEGANLVDQIKMAIVTAHDSHKQKVSEVLKATLRALNGESDYPTTYMRGIGSFAGRGRGRGRGNFGTR